MSEELFENVQPEEAENTQGISNPYAQPSGPGQNTPGMPDSYAQPSGPEQNTQSSSGQNPYTQQGYTQNMQNSYTQQGYAQNMQNPYTQQGYAQNMQNMQNPYMQQGYAPQQAKPPKGDGIGFGIASLVLGIASVFLFGCCVNYITAILAIVFAVVQMVKNRQKGMAIAGIVTACVSIILGTVMWIGVSSNMDDVNINDFYDNFYEYYEDEYPLNNYIDEL